MKVLSSRDNPHFKALKKLAQSSRERQKSGLILLDGLHLIESYGQAFGALEEIFVSEAGCAHAEIAYYLANAPAASPVFRVSDALFKELAPVASPSGVLTVAKMPKSTQPLNSACDSLLLDGIQDPGNLGSILRSAAAAGFRQILLSVDCAQVWSPKTLRAGMGAHFALTLHEAQDLPAFLAGYQGQSIATSLATDTSLYSLCLKNPVAWVFGNEGQGIRPAVAHATQRKIRIPMPGAAESLNVAAAAAICLFETLRQRRLPETRHG